MTSIYIQPMYPRPKQLLPSPQSPLPTTTIEEDPITLQEIEDVKDDSLPEVSSKSS